MPITVLLADDHAILRQGVRMMLSAEPDIAVVGEASNGLEALHLVEKLHPDILVVDLQLPGLPGLEVTRQVTQQYKQTQVVVLSMFSSEGYVSEALRKGAKAYVIKEADAKDLLRAIREVKRGKQFLSPSIRVDVIELYRRKTGTGALDPYETLTNRERQVLQLAAEGKNNPEIAERLSISIRTAEAHRAKVLHKLGLENQTELVRYAVRRGFLPLEE